VRHIVIYLNYTSILDLYEVEIYDLQIRSSTARQKDCEDAIIDYLVKNPQGSHKHINKERVIEAVTAKQKGSRVTIRDALKRLHRSHIINIDKDKENSQTHWVSLNSDSEMRRIMENIQKIKDTFFELLQEASTLPNVPTYFDDNNDPDPDGVVTLAELAIIRLFQHLVGIYMLYFLLEWPKKITDVFTRFQLYTLTFQKIQEIQIRILEVFPHPDQDTDVRDMIIKKLYILETPKDLHRTVDALENVGFGKQTGPLLDQLWKFGLPFVKYGDRTVSGWRDVVAVIREGYARSDRNVRRSARKIINEWAEKNKLPGSADSHGHPQEGSTKSKTGI
jgi:hypothetical protein